MLVFRHDLTNHPRCLIGRFTPGSLKERKVRDPESRRVSTGELVRFVRPEGNCKPLGSPRAEGRCALGSPQLGSVQKLVILSESTTGNEAEDKLGLVTARVIRPGVSPEYKIDVLRCIFIDVCPGNHIYENMVNPEGCRETRGSDAYHQGKEHYICKRCNVRRNFRILLLTRDVRVPEKNYCPRLLS
ncbi:hypothetical protein RUM44_012846 [Polyplax serrata]|uniref:Uncharacterized protein n=1 Tax=Polyplax serrata TaxID=468196 RepID=A0ABR1BCS5_POLSC